MPEATTRCDSEERSCKVCPQHKLLVGMFGTSVAIMVAVLAFTMAESHNTSVKLSDYDAGAKARMEAIAGLKVEVEYLRRSVDKMDLKLDTLRLRP